MAGWGCASALRVPFWYPEVRGLVLNLQSTQVAAHLPQLCDSQDAGRDSLGRSSAASSGRGVCGGPLSMYIPVSRIFNSVVLLISPPCVRSSKQ